jgi:hypothetical protein
MFTQHGMFRLWLAGMACLMSTAVIAQERTANYAGQGNPNAGQVRPVNWGQGPFMNTYQYNPWANYAPGYNVYPNHSDPNRGYVAYSHTCGGNCPWTCRFQQWQNDNAACRANFGRRFRCGMSFLRPLTYWDIGAQTDIIALDPGYSHPNDANGIYAAQGYGGPVTVPLAPNVRSAYNYSWGIPSSRLTPITHPVPQ